MSSLNRDLSHHASVQLIDQACDPTRASIFPQQRPEALAVDWVERLLEIIEYDLQGPVLLS